MTTQYAHGMQIMRTGGQLGAEVCGVDMSRPMGDDLKELLRHTWHEHLVLLFRGQNLDEEALLSIADCFGGCQPSASRDYLINAGHQPGSSARLSTNSAVSIISNLDDDGRPVRVTEGSGSLPLAWHSDNSYVLNPPRGTLLHARVVPEDGSGQTTFSNQYLAYERLPQELKSRLHELHLCHDNCRNTTGRLRPSVKAPRSRDDISGPIHPLVRLHPETLKPALYLGRHHEWPSSYIPELTDDESESLLSELWSHATAADLTWTHKWSVGDLLLWDNRCTLHSRSAVNHTLPRVMLRALVKGEPVRSASSTEHSNAPLEPVSEGPAA